MNLKISLLMSVCKHKINSNNFALYSESKVIYNRKQFSYKNKYDKKKANSYF